MLGSPSYPKPLAGAENKIRFHEGQGARENPNAAKVISYLERLISIGRVPISTQNCPPGFFEIRSADGTLYNSETTPDEATLHQLKARLYALLGLQIPSPKSFFKQSSLEAHHQAHAPSPHHQDSPNAHEHKKELDTPMTPECELNVKGIEPKLTLYQNPSSKESESVKAIHAFLDKHIDTKSVSTKELEEGKGDFELRHNDNVLYNAKDGVSEERLQKLLKQLHEAKTSS